MTGRQSRGDPAPQRKIIHVDMDCFFAAVEMLRHPEYRQRPLAVGGDPARRGVIATCNYEAREYGIHSAMSAARARQLCPDLVILPPDIDAYREVSRRIGAIFRRYSDLVEPLSLDEAYLDVTASPHCQGSATRMATAIREAIFAQEGLTASAGVAPNKLLAKVASDWHKPNGQFVITPREVAAFVARLPVKKLFGVGPVTARRLAARGIHTCADLQALSSEALIEHHGAFGERLYALCRGIDTRPVQPRRTRKSLSVEHTYPADLTDLAACQAALPDLLDALAKRLRSHHQASRRAGLHHGQRVAGLFVKVKFADFSQTTVQCPGTTPDGAIYQRLLADGFARRSLPVRLLGVGVRFAPASQAKAVDPPAQGTLLPG